MANFGYTLCEKSATFCSASRHGATRGMLGELELFGKAWWLATRQIIGFIKLP